ncbi:MAG: molybdopterin molybdenumtransferase MoeA, partial [Gemmatimonadetes bacterium]
MSEHAEPGSRGPAAEGAAAGARPEDRDGPEAPRFERRAADWLPVTAALEQVLAAARPLPPEDVALGEALGRALAEDVTAPWALPPWDNAGMDGYAVRAEDVRGASPDAPVTLEVVGVARAGALELPSPGPGQAVRIMTGAPLPEGADSVVRVEGTDAEAGQPGRVRVLADRDAGGNVRPGGQDWAAGERLLSAGTTVTPGVVAVLAAAGRSSVRVHGRPTVALLPNGDELAPPHDHERLRAGHAIPESNSHTLAAAVRQVGAHARRLDPVPDDEDALAAALARTLDADVLVTLGGASMGEGDLIKRVLDRHGFELDFWRVRMRPGSPVSFGLLARPEGPPLPVFGLPGNPASAFVTFQVFVRPFVLALAGHARVHRRVVRATAAEDIPSV